VDKHAGNIKMVSRRNERMIKFGDCGTGNFIARIVLDC
jgi:hypothetical protein